MAAQGAQRLGGVVRCLAVCGALSFGLSAPVTSVAQAVPAANDAAAMATTIHELRGCLKNLKSSERRLLALRFGIGGHQVQTDAAVGRQLRLSPTAVANGEVVAVRQLTVAHQLGACAAIGATNSTAANSRPATAATTAPAGKGVAARADSQAAADTVVPHSSGGGVSVGELLAILLIVTCLVVVAREFRKALYPTPPRG